MNVLEQIKNIDKEKKSLVLSIGAHIIILILLFMPWMTYQNPPPEQEGVLVTFGEINVGLGDDNPIAQNEENNLETNTESESNEKEVAPPIEQVESQPKEVKINVEQKEDILTTKKVDQIALKEAKEAEEKRKKIAREREIAKKKQAEAEAKAKEEARKKAEAKKRYSAVFGSGRGDTESSGNQGVKNGNPDKGKLKGISTGSGMVGGGLGNRGLEKSPEINDKSQKAGRVVVDVCVNSKGQVISSRYTQRGSTTTDKELREIAEQNARKFKFSPSNIDKQCGTITIDFKLK